LEKETDLLRSSLNLSSLQIKDLVSSKEKAEKDNESLQESQKFISAYIESLKSSFNDTINNLSSKLTLSTSQVEDLSSKLSASKSTIQELSQALNFQKEENERITEERKSPTPYSMKQLRKNFRQQTLPSCTTVHKSKKLENLKKQFKNKALPSEVFALIGAELDEEDPHKFIEKIIEIKKQSDMYYMTAEHLEDLLEELKDALDEENPNNLLNRVVKLRDEVEGNR
jgi:uncharacterized protein (UPF0305 family)